MVLVLLLSSESDGSASAKLFDDAALLYQKTCSGEKAIELASVPSGSSHRVWRRLIGLARACVAALRWSRVLDCTCAVLYPFAMPVVTAPSAFPGSGHRSTCESCHPASHRGGDSVRVKSQIQHNPSHPAMNRWAAATVRYTQLPVALLIIPLTQVIAAHLALSLERSSSRIHVRAIDRRRGEAERLAPPPAPFGRRRPLLPRASELSPSRPSLASTHTHIHTQSHISEY